MVAIRVITSRQGAGAYKVRRSRGRIIVERIEQKAEFTPIAQLVQM